MSDKLHKIKTFQFKAKDIELKAIKHYASMSEETYCYEANLYVLGVKVGRVSNRGHGGGDDWDGDHDKGFNHSWLAELDIWCRKTLPKWHSKWDDSYNQKCFEVWCSEQVSDYIDSKEFNKLYNNKISFIEPNQKGLSYWNAKPTKETLTRLEKRHPQYDFLNLMTKEEAFKIFKEHG